MYRRINASISVEVDGLISVGSSLFVSVLQQYQQYVGGYAPRYLYYTRLHGRIQVWLLFGFIGSCRSDADHENALSVALRILRSWLEMKQVDYLLSKTPFSLSF